MNHQDDQKLLERQETDLEGRSRAIADEFRAGFEAVASIGRPGVTIFGSARIREDNPYYAAARTAGRLFAEAGFAVVTGGGPGVMEAANRGAVDAGGVSVGFNIRLPHEQDANPYVGIGAHVRPLLHAQGDAREGGGGLRALPGRVRDARRAVRGAHARADRQGLRLPRRAHGNRVLAGAARLHRRDRAAPGDDRPGRPGAALLHGRSAGGGAAGVETSHGLHGDVHSSPAKADAQ